VTNPYLNEVLRGKADRDTLVRKYAWGIPNDAAINALKDIAPIVEIGAGVGYWAWLLRCQGVDVIAYDKHPTSQSQKNTFHKENPEWTEVCKGGADQAAKHASRSLFLCWPPLGEFLASEALDLYEGNHIAYVGSPSFTGNHAFHRKLFEDFDERKVVEIPTWPGLDDKLTIYQRKRRIITLTV